MKTLNYKNKDGQLKPIGVFNVQTPVVSQETGDSEKEVMSQKATTDELLKKQDKLPNGEVGQVLTKTEDGVEWSNVEAGGEGGEVDLSEYEKIYEIEATGDVSNDKNEINVTTSLDKIEEIVDNVIFDNKSNKGKGLVKLKINSLRLGNSGLNNLCLYPEEIIYGSNSGSKSLDLTYILHYADYYYIIYISYSVYNKKLSATIRKYSNDDSSWWDVEIHDRDTPPNGILKMPSFKPKNSNNTITGILSIAEGLITTASGNYSHAEGWSTTSEGECAHSEGRNSKALGKESHAEGSSAQAIGNVSHAEGCATITNNNCEHSQGIYNISETDGSNGGWNSAISGSHNNTLHSVGNGGDLGYRTIRHNAHEIRQDGTEYPYYEKPMFNLQEKLKQFDDKLEGVTKAADDSDVIKGIEINDALKQSLELTRPDFITDELLHFTFNEGFSIDFEKASYGDINVSIDTNYLATRTYVDDKINFLVNSEGELEDSFDTLKEVDTWIKEHEGEAADIISRQNALENWKNDAIILLPNYNNGSTRVLINDNKVEIGLAPYNIGTKTWTSSGTNAAYITIPSATPTEAGVMSAKDKTKLDSINNIIIEVQATNEDIGVNINNEDLSALINAVTNNNTQTQVYLKIPVSFDLFAYVPTKIVRVDNNADTFYIVGELSGIEYTVTVTTHEEETEVEISTNELFSDFATLEDTKTSIVGVYGETLSIEVGKYYRFDRPVETLEITLPQVEDTTHTSNVKVFFTTGSIPQITINGNGAEVRYFKGYSIQANTSYELDIMWNGDIWVVAQAKVE